MPYIVLLTPFFPHVLEAWNKRHHPNMHYMFFEDMKSVKRIQESVFINTLICIAF